MDTGRLGTDVPHYPKVVLVTGDRFSVSLSSHRALLQAGLR